MAVYRRRYRASGSHDASGPRFAVFTRYALRELLGSRIFVLYMVLSLISPVVGAILVYLHHNPLGMQVLQQTVNELVPIDVTFFMRLLIIQTSLGSVLAAIVGPGLVAPDLANNALPLYLARPITRRDYIVGKLAVLGAVMSVLTWIPLLALFALQSALAGWSWLVPNLGVAAGVVLCSALWIMVVALLTLAVSAWVRLRPIATLAVFGYFFVSGALSEMVNTTLLTSWGSLFSPPLLMRSLWTGVFRLPAMRGDLPPAIALAALALTCLAFLAMLLKRVRAYEVAHS